MASALSALSNATATFQVAGAGVVTDPETGNVAPAGATVTVAFFLSAAQTRVLRYPGVDTTETIYEGYAVDALDPRIEVGVTGTLTFAGEQTLDCEVRSLRLPYGKTGLLGSTLNSVLGEKVQLVCRGQA